MHEELVGQVIAMTSLPWRDDWWTRVQVETGSPVTVGLANDKGSSHVCCHQTRQGGAPGEGVVAGVVVEVVVE